MGVPLRLTGGGEHVCHKKRAEDLDSSQRVRDNSIAYHLAPAITDFSRSIVPRELKEIYSSWGKKKDQR